MNRKCFAILAAAVLLVMCAVTVSAEAFDPGKTGSVTVTLTEQTEMTPIAGAELSLYYIARVGINAAGQLNYTCIKTYTKAGIELEDPELSAKLDAYLAENPATDTKAVTDGTGTAVFENLPLGLYFVRQTGAVEGYAPCKSFLVTVPAEGADGYAYAVNATPKTEVAKLTDITIRKVWNTDASTKAADSVTVQLLRDGNVVETAILSDENDWQVTYTGLPESDAYSIKEVPVPKGFTATYKQKGYVFTVTNTSSLIQTGQLVWPIPLLAVVGVLLLAAGTVLLRKKGRHHA